MGNDFDIVTELNMAAAHEPNLNASDLLRKAAEIIDHLEREVTSVTTELKMSRDLNDNNVWYWQGDGWDNLESLVCPVLISSNQLLAMTEEANKGYSSVSPGVYIQETDDVSVASFDVSGIILNDSVTFFCNPNVAESDFERAMKGV